ncbi:MAG: adenylate kinase [Saprospiraceae bacterium]|nr:adenylate kinase [Saprospiraceae bacterium]MDW8485298.1 adenylate kinase [Saprospiraceae bacterium]
MLNLILFGPPGSGKGTQALRLIDRYHLVHISTGDLFRQEMGRETPLGKEAKAYISRGELVPDHITIGMLRNKVNAHPEAEGFIFDGFPRTLAQAEALDQLMAEEGTTIHLLIALDVDDEEIVRRIRGRAAISGRADDANDTVVRNRLAVYKNETAPVFDYYAKQGKSHRIDGMGSVEEIFQRLCTLIDQTIHSLKKGALI